MQAAANAHSHNWISQRRAALFNWHLLVQSCGDPFHLWPVSCRLLRDDDVAAVWKHRSKSVQHSICSADNSAVELRVGLVEPTGQADSARHRIDFSNNIAFIR